MICMNRSGFPILLTAVLQCLRGQEGLSYLSPGNISSFTVFQ